MNKLECHLNKKKQLALRDGKSLFYYPADEEIVNVRVGNTYYITVKESERG